ncbi:MAG TPA: BrnT family toxin [Armatimonadota bacterium]|nr:BrnT family toxin [Armatimonadota bacterium]
MRIIGFIWLEDIVEKLWRKHHVEQYEVEEVFGNHPYFRFVENGYRVGEDVYAALGQTDGGRYLVVFFVHKADGRALIVSARDMTQAERRHYEKR